jgi:uncharacterized protein with HEPN domain
MPSNTQATHRWLTDILHHMTMAEGFIAGITLDTFQNDMMRFHATTRCLEIISEASRRLPDELKARHTTIPWQEMAAAGNIYRHEYEDVAARAVWHTVTYHLPKLRVVIAQEIAVLGAH